MQRSNWVPGYMFTVMCTIITVMISCKKDNTAPALDASAIYIKEAATADTVSYLVSSELDTLIVMQVTPVMKGAGGKGKHVVTFRVDTGSINNYRAKYGDAYLLPSTCYNVAWLSCPQVAGTDAFQPAEINIVNETQLRASSKYVLPVVLQSVDNDTTGIARDQVLYLQVRTKESSIISKADWKVAAVSSEYKFAGLPAFDAYFAAVNAIDYDLGSSWTTDPAQPMPQYITIDMGEQTQLGAITFLGGYGSGTSIFCCPAQMKVELSVDGTHWTDMGTFPCANTTDKQILFFGATPARYFKLTTLQLQPNQYQLQITDIGALR